MADVTYTGEDKRATAIQGHCDECSSKIDFDNKDYIPEDPIHTYHHCSECGLVNYIPDKAKSFTPPPDGYKHWWGNSRKP